MKRYFIVTLAVVLALSLSGLVLADDERIDLEWNNLARVNQEGKGNDANVIQGGILQKADVDQEGQWNIATLNQSGNSNISDTNQLGTANNLYVYQDNDQWNHIATATIYQNGEHNDAEVYQYDSWDNNRVARPKIALIEQWGKGNFASINQKDGGRMEAKIHQEGSGNYASQVQEHLVGHKYLFATVIQTGTGNEARQTQLSSETLWARIEQEGNHNLATTFQDDGFLNSESVKFKVRNTAGIYQTGSNNKATVIQ